MTNNEARFILLNSEHTKSSDVVEAYITDMIIFSGLGESPFTLWDESEIIDDFNQWLHTEFMDMSADDGEDCTWLM